MHDGHRPMPSPSPDSQRYTKLQLDTSNHTHKLISYTVTEDRSVEERIVTWTTTTGTIKHFIPMIIPGIPYTYHSTYKKENVVVFRAYDSKGLMKHKFKFQDNDNQTTTSFHIPEYQFRNKDEFDEFQSRVRGRNLLKTFDTESISLTTSAFLLPKKTREHARKKPIKIWRRNDTAITFFATSEVEYQTHFQFYLSWFKNNAELRSDNKLILKFNSAREVEQQHENRPSEHKRRLSDVFTPSKGKRQKAEEPVPRRISLTGSSSNNLVVIHGGALNTDDCIKENHWESLEIQFSSQDDVQNFVDTCLESQTKQGLTPSQGPHFVSPFKQTDPLPIRPHFPPSPMSPSVASSTKNQELEDELNKRRAAIDKWWKNFNDNRDEIFPIITDNYAPVKIAILDTGIDMNNPYIQKNWRSRKLYRDFLDDDTVASNLRSNSSPYSSHYVREVVASLQVDGRQGAVDLAGHGTHLAGIVLQLAPHATLCVARVLKDNMTTYDTGAAVKRVALAILFAVEVWKVKVINLSVGFDQGQLNDPEIQIMTHALQYARQQNVVVLAAASNSGNRELLAFPACQPDDVLSINSTDGSGGRSWFNPKQQEYHENLSILGENIKSTWLQVDYGKEEVILRGDSAWKRSEGTSQATTVAACVAVLILQFGRQYSVGEKLETFKGVRSVLRKMTGTQTGDGFWDIVPWMEVFCMSPKGVDSIKSRILDILYTARV